jgi:hypothetical protein
MARQGHKKVHVLPGEGGGALSESPKRASQAYGPNLWGMTE